MTHLSVIWLLFFVLQDWPQFGGANRNFTSAVTGLANSWPREGPPEAWSRDLGEGYSAITVEGGKAFTMYRDPAGVLSFGRQDEEVVTALSAEDGIPIWEYRYEAPSLPGMDLEYGPGPHTAPLVVGNRLFTVGAMGDVFAFDKHTGKVYWSTSLYHQFGVVWGRGYSFSPIAYKDTIILATGKRGQSVIALNQANGRIVWRKHDFDYGPASPILIDVDGQPQLVLFMAEGPVGLDPENGELLWTHPHKTDWGLNISMPLWGSGNVLFLSSAYNGGSRALHLTQAGGKTVVKELWATNRMRIHFGSAVRIGDYVYGSSGDFGPAFLAAVDVNTGRILWQDRTFARASMVYADGKVVLLDEDGTLALATVSPEGLKVLSRAEVLTSNAWTPPTLAGKRLFIRDRKTIRAFDLN